MNICTLCPRNCGVNRDNQIGACGVSNKIYLARAALHHWEEPCISGKTGSGTVFFSGCALHCLYCQNRSVSLAEVAKEVSQDRLAEIFLELQEKHAENINLVTPDHYIPQIQAALSQATETGLHIPIVYNTSSYITPESLRMIDDSVSVYLADMKYLSKTLSKNFSGAENYPETAQKAIAEMVARHPTPEFDDSGMMTDGVIVRHLVLPGHTDDSKRVIRYLYETYGDAIYLSIMNQYTPCRSIPQYPELNRKLTASEYDEVLDFAVQIGVEQAFIQEGDAAEESFIPLFDYEGI